MFKWIVVMCLAASSSLMAETKILAFSGSTREGSTNKKLICEAASIARQMGATVTVIDLRDFSMPLYDGDLEEREGMPTNAKRLRNLMIESNAIMIASPEYNGSVSAVLKNALDWASRSEDAGSSRSAFKGKKFAIMSATPGNGGGVRGLGHLRSIIENIGGQVIPQQVSITNSYEAFNEQGILKSVQSQQELRQLIRQLL